MLKLITLTTSLVMAFAAGPAAHNELDLNNLAQRVDRLVDSSSVLLNNGMNDDARSLFQNASDEWREYVEYHNYVADREFARMEKLDTLIADISGRFETALKDDINRALPELKERLKDLFQSADLPILADFSGTSCKNCKIMKTRLTKIAPEYEGKVRIVYVNVNTERDLVKQYRIALIPTLVFIGLNGEEAFRCIGAIEENDLRKKLNTLIIN